VKKNDNVFDIVMPKKKQIFGFVEKTTFKILVVSNANTPLNFF